MNIHIMEPPKKEKKYPILGRDAEGFPYIKYNENSRWFNIRYGILVHQDLQIRELDASASITLTQQ